MITYNLWKDFIDQFTIYTSTADKIFTYSFCSFISIFTILIDILTLPFQLIGIVIYQITKSKT